MQPVGETISHSPLNKPLCQLSEDDISLLAREDCRAYLKQKGMRRTSWNKSQAIQQVISLKALFETTPDSYIPPRSHHRFPANSSVSAKETGTDSRICQSPGRYDLSKHDFSGDPPVCCVVTGDYSTPLRACLLADEFRIWNGKQIRTKGLANEPIARMTIFYCGKVNFYNDVPRDMARAIMQLAADPHSLSGNFN